MYVEPLFRGSYCNINSNYIYIYNSSNKYINEITCINVGLHPFEAPSIK